MKSILKISILSILIFSLLLPLAAQANASVTKVNGKVEMQAPGGSWSAVNAGDEIALGSTISTGFRSTAVLQVGSAVLEVKQLTRMRLDELIAREGVVKTELFLRVGRVKAEVKQREGLQQDFRLKSPVSTAAVRGTGFDYDGVNLRVAEGLVALANAYGQSIAVAAGQEVSMAGLDLPPEGLAALEALFDVNTSAAQLEELFGNLPAPDGSAGSSVTVEWVQPSRG